MIRSVLFLGRKHAESHNPDRTTAAICITDPAKKRSHLHHSITKKIQLAFDDSTESSVGLTEEMVPDLMLRHEEGRRIMANGDELCDYNDARKIFEFLEKIANDPVSFNILVHCEYGISRSAAVAEFIHRYYGAPILNQNITTSAMNKRLIRLLEKVSNQIPATIGNLPDHCLEMKKLQRMRSF